MEDREPPPVTTDRSPAVEDREPPPPALPARRRVGLAIVGTLHALPFAAAALVVPTVGVSWFGVSTAVLALLHLALAVLALTRQRRALAVTWTVLSACSLLWLFAISWIMVSASLYLSVLYEDIGQAISGALACVWGLVVLFTVPISLWGLASTRPRWLFRRPAVATILIALLAASATSLALRSTARAAPVHGAHDDVAGLLLGALAAHGRAPDGSVHASLLHTTPARCREPVDTERLTLLLSSLDPQGQPFAACLQTRDARTLAVDLTRLLAARARAGAPVELDLVSGVQPVPVVHPLLDALSLRPALDGVCSRGSCLAPWQLVALDAFTRYRPLDAVQDARFGVALPELAHSLGAPDERDLARIETKSWLWSGGTFIRLVRMRPERVAADEPALSRAAQLAGRHLVAAQRTDGSFRYLLDPFSGRSDDRVVNLPRQAGTLFALCELFPGLPTSQAAVRALGQLASFEKRSGELSALSDDASVAELGRTALPLIAFAACRDHVGDRHDALLGRLARFVLAMQRADGSFYPTMALPAATAHGAHEPLYAAGQAVLSLVLMEQLARALPSRHWPDTHRLSAAITRAMTHYGRAYWPKPLRSLFYLEENWHCLAARAALRSHRDDDYEQFCLDYVSFKQRLILDARSGASPEHVGGYGLSNMFPPHSTATAGFAEALAAAIPVAHARGLPLTERQATLRSVLGFVVRQQWTEQNCFACGANAEAVGGFSESSASPGIRIDYVQHALAALGHGRRALALTSALSASAR